MCFAQRGHPPSRPHWLDVHASLVIGARDALNEHLPEDLIASAEERVAVESQSGEEHRYGPEVRVFEPPAETLKTVESEAENVQAPYRLLAQVEPMIERFLRIIALIDRAYASGRYHRRLDYSKPCDPPLEAGDDSWADALLRSAGKR